MSYNKLFEPGKIGSLEVRNRVIMSPLAAGLENPDGTISDRAIAYYKERAKNGVGLIILDYTRINESDGVSSIGQASLASDKYIEGMRKMADAIHAEGAKFFVQLQHPGRQASPMLTSFWPMIEKLAEVYPDSYKAYSALIAKTTNNGTEAVPDADPRLIKAVMHTMKPLYAPSVIPLSEPDVALNMLYYKELTVKEIKRIVSQFVDAAERAKKAGVDGVELHAAHGYLLQLFLSPFSNRRTDEYGGSAENRVRILKEIIDGIHARCGADYPISVRISADELEQYAGHPERGYHMDTGAVYAKLLENYGVDLINVSIGSPDTSNTTVESSNFPLSWRNEIIQAVKDAVSIPVAGVSSIRTPAQAEENLEAGVQDFIVLGRALLADPEWVTKAAEGREKEISRCISCMRCRETLMSTMMLVDHVECSQNPRLGREYCTPMVPANDGNGRRVAVVGAGVAGLTAATELALRGFDVTVYEKEETVGGQLNLAKMPPNKERIIWSAEDRLERAKAAGANVVFGTEMTAEKLIELDPFATVLSTGGFAFKPRIPGADADYVTTVSPVLKGDLRPEGKNVVVVGSGMTGLETTELLSLSNNRLTVVEMANKIAPGADADTKKEAMQPLEEYGVRFLPGHKLEKIEDHKVYLTDKKGAETVLDADVVVLSLGVRSDNALANELDGKLLNVYTIGDAEKIGRVVNAVRAGFDTARKI